MLGHKVFIDKIVFLHQQNASQRAIISLAYLGSVSLKMEERTKKKLTSRILGTVVLLQKSNDKTSVNKPIQSCFCYNEI